MSPTSTPYYTFDGEELIKGVWEPIILDTGSRLSWSDLHPYNGEVNEEVLKTIFIVPDLLSGGDYSNSSESSPLESPNLFERVQKCWGRS